MRKLALALLVALLPCSALAGTVSNPHVYVDGETLNAANLNAPLQVLYTLVNGNIDNTNIGTAGIFASQMKPGTTGQATFGGSVGYVFTSNGTSQVPLTIALPNLSGADAFDVNINGGTAEFTIDSAGVVHANAGIMASSATIGALSTTGALTGTTGSFTGLVSTAGTISATGNVQAGGNITAAGNMSVQGYSYASQFQDASGLAIQGNAITATGQLQLNANPGNNAVLVNYGSSATAGLSVFDGSTSNPGPFSAGNITAAGITASGIINANAGITSSGQTTIYGSPAVLVNYGGGGNGGFSVYNGGTSGLGPISASTASFSGAVSAAGGNVPPLYTTNGSPVGTSAHSVVGSVTASASGNTTITLTGAAAFTGLGTYACHVTNTTVSYAAVTVFETTGALFAIANNNAFTVPVAYECTGY